MRNGIVVALSLFLLTAAAPHAPAPREPVTIAEFDDPAGDVKAEMTGGGKERLPYDVVHLALTSDGKNVLVAVTLKEIPPDMLASNAVTLYFDTDNNKLTGAPSFHEKKPGFEYKSEVLACIKYTNGGETCMGELSGKDFRGKEFKVESRYGVAGVEKFTGSNPTATETVRSEFKATETPLDGKVLRATISYADLGAKSGQVVRILARESDGIEGAADFPDVLLKLK